jgi:hypothetical protein
MGRRGWPAPRDRDDQLDRCHPVRSHLPDGRIIETGTTTATTVATSVALNGSYTAPPVILTSRMNTNGPNFTDSDPSNIMTPSFDISLQKGTLAKGVITGETVGDIAISPGARLYPASPLQRCSA